MVFLLGLWKRNCCAASPWLWLKTTGVRFWSRDHVSVLGFSAIVELLEIELFLLLPCVLGANSFLFVFVNLPVG